ncbi:MAG: NnrS family protein [Paracoccaceae bacterium]
MAISSAEQMRQWQGHALFSYGFRPFFLFGALWAGLAMVLWVLVLAGALALPSRLDPLSWHAHAFLFGYLSAVIAGFLLTAVPNWTGRLPVVGRALAGLFGIWLLGRGAVLFSALLPFWLVALLELAFPLVLGLMILREILAGKNWKNFVVLVMLGVFALADALFLYEAAQGGIAAQGIGFRLGLGTVLMMISLIGGRIIPSFTRNWLAREKLEARPSSPMQAFDKAVLLSSALGLLLWVIAPAMVITALALACIGGLHLARLMRWKGLLTFSDPLVAILHISYLLVPLGAIAMSLAILMPDLLSTASAQHLWMAGAFGGMTLAVMTRASLGHTGHALKAGPGTKLIYAAILAATAARFIAGIWPSAALVDLTAALWCTAFFGFVALYGPLLWRPKERAS